MSFRALADLESVSKRYSSKIQLYKRSRSEASAVSGAESILWLFGRGGDVVVVEADGTTNNVGGGDCVAADEAAIDVSSRCCNS